MSEPIEILSSEEPTDDEWENRILCRDGNCIGVIGGDGRCKECGLPYDQTPPAGEDPTHLSPPDSAPPEPEESDTDSEDLPDEYWRNRVLCKDGNCIGVIGPDGLCKACGKSYS